MSADTAGHRLALRGGARGPGQSDFEVSLGSCLRDQPVHVPAHLDSELDFDLVGADLPDLVKYGLRALYCRLDGLTDPPQDLLRGDVGPLTGGVHLEPDPCL